MAVINTDEDFALAVGYLVDTGQLPVAGSRYIDAPARKVYDERPGELVDITPSQQVLEAALDAGRLVVALEQARDEARALLISGKQYIREQLESTSPASFQAQVAFLRPRVIGNVFLAGRMQKLTALFNAAFGWSLNANPVSSPNWERWLKVFLEMVAIET